MAGLRGLLIQFLRSRFDRIGRGADISHKRMQLIHKGVKRLRYIANLILALNFNPRG
ncbi:Uncharacterised protein [Vibrio cholerae]|nr:Uncharacterised protein [Vibrio cholerae]CSB85408.1 Uncharacterised protein [Vibrio cholerae]CSC50968.1 Uncharacterised protein [Vibrio cholerae]CSC63914.1 Uncharacterised protein [Vibrio cholerae]CSC72167.1 Uncharacterised protein [Vibrio cholerae]